MDIDNDIDGWINDENIKLTRADILEYVENSSTFFFCSVGDGEKKGGLIWHTKGDDLGADSKLLLNIAQRFLGQIMACEENEFLEKAMKEADIDPSNKKNLKRALDQLYEIFKKSMENEDEK